MGIDAIVLVYWIVRHVESIALNRVNFEKINESFAFNSSIDQNK